MAKHNTKTEKKYDFFHTSSSFILPNIQRIESLCGDEEKKERKEI